MIVATGPEVTPGPLKETVYLQDLGPTAMAALGVPSAIPRDGKVIESLVGHGVELSVTGARARTSLLADVQTGLTSDEEGEIEDQLRGLGYVE